MNLRRRHEATPLHRLRGLTAMSSCRLPFLQVLAGWPAVKEELRTISRINLLVCFDVLARPGFPAPNVLGAADTITSVGFDEILLLVSLVCNTQSCGSVLLKE